MITLISWAPFLLFSVIYGIIFMVLGFKRGSIRSAVSIVMTVVSAVISIVIAKLASAPIGKLISDKVLDMLTESNPEIADIDRINVLAEGISGALSALILYIPVFLLVSLIIKCVVSAIMKAVCPKADNVFDRIGGLTIALVDALLFAFLLTLPIYGTMALANDVLDVAEVYAEKETQKQEGVVYNNKPFEIIKEATGSPIVSLAGTPPFSTAYNVLLTFKFEGSSINIPSTVRSVTGLAEELVMFSDADSILKDKTALLSLVRKTEDFLLKNEFVTDIACGFLSDKIPSVKLGDMKFELVEYYSAIADGELFREDLPAFVDLLEAMVESGMIDALNGEGFDTAKVDAEMISTAFGRTFNHSPAIATFKTKIVKEAVSVFVEELIENNGDETGAITKFRDTVMALPEAPLSADEAKKEGEALYMFLSGIMTGINDSKHAGKAIGMFIEGMARHPEIDTDEVIETAKALLSKNGLPGTEKIVESIKTKLNDSVSKPVGQGTFPDFCDAAFTTATTLSNIASGEGGTEGFKTLITSSPEVLETVKDTVTTDLLEEIGMGEESEKVNDVINSVFDAMIEVELTEDEAEKEAAALNEIMSMVSDVTSSETITEEAVKERADALIDTVASSKVVEKTLENLTEGNVSDPTGLFSELDDDAKAEITDKINSYISENGENATLEALKLFMGLK